MKISITRLPSLNHTHTHTHTPEYISVLTAGGWLINLKMHAVSH